MEPSNDSFLALLEERISKRDGNSGKKLIPTGHTVFYTLRVDALCAIRYKLFTTISVALLKCAPPIAVNNFRKVAPFFDRGPSPTDITSIFNTIGVRHSKSRTEIMWKMSWVFLHCLFFTFHQYVSFFRFYESFGFEHSKICWTNWVSRVE